MYYHVYWIEAGKVISDYPDDPINGNKGVVLFWGTCHPHPDKVWCIKVRINMPFRKAVEYNYFATINNQDYCTGKGTTTVKRTI